MKYEEIVEALVEEIDKDIGADTIEDAYEWIFERLRDDVIKKGTTLM